jgi:hypothetical protein
MKYHRAANSLTAIASQVIFRVFPRKDKARVLAPYSLHGHSGNGGEGAQCIGFTGSSFSKEAAISPWFVNIMRIIKHNIIFLELYA